jgi:hypothetical protein
MLCPVDLAPCLRPECRGGLCAQADAATLAICWECGSIEAHGMVAGICVACIAADIPARTEEE